MKLAWARWVVVLVGAAVATPQTARSDGAALPSPFGTLADKYGVAFNLGYTGEFASNVAGGAGQGSDYAGQVAIGADVDMQKLMGLTGGAFHVEFTDRSGRDLSNDTINNSVSPQEIYGGGQTYELTTLTYEQKLFGGLIDLEGGRTELDQVALQDPIYCQFESNGICGQPDIMGKIITASFYPVAVWGARAKITPYANTYVSLGLYDNDPTNSMPTNHGFDFGLGGSRGALIPVEVGYETTLANDPYPRRYDIGAVIDRTSYDYVTYNPASMTMGSTAGHGREMIYGQARQVVYRPDMTSPRGLTLFGAVIVGPDSNQPVDYDVTGGAVYLGPFAARPLDSIGIAADLTHYRSRFIDQLQDYRIGALGGSQRPSSMLVMTELHYQFAVTSWLNIMPDVQYIFNPDGLGTLPYPKANLPNAWVFGIKFAAEWK